jgi:hypothetical protein
LVFLPEKVNFTHSSPTEFELMYSTFIKDLMDIPSDSPLDSAPIYLNQATHFVRKFVDLIYCSNSSNVRISFKDHMALTEICDQLHCSGVDEAIWTATKLQLEEIGKSPGFTAWETFRVAALRNDGKTAAKAIRSFEQYGKEFDYISSPDPKYYDGIPPRYLSALLAGNFQPVNAPRSGGQRTQETYARASWEDIAKRFERMI